MNNPLVTIICLCHNQAPFVLEALDSVENQTYPDIQLIIVDDASIDDSREVIREWGQARQIECLFLERNVGNCRAFNKGLALAKGHYIIDLAADDILLPRRVEEGVRALGEAGKDYGVNFTDAAYIDEGGDFLRNHYKRDRTGNLSEKVPQGWIYEELLKRYFVCTPSMMFRREVLDELKGYDETLAYEDFDFWIRSARNWKYCFTDKVLVHKRVVKGSWSARQYEKESRQLETTLAVCLKAKWLNRTKGENKALGKRLSYEIRQAIRSGHFEAAAKMLDLKHEVAPFFPEDAVYGILIRRKISFPKLPN